MKLPDGWYDGEIIVRNAQGVPDFQALQSAFDSSKTKDIVYYLFDLPFCNGYDLRQLPLIERRTKLESLLRGAGRKPPGAASSRLPDSIRFSDVFDVPANDMMASACKLGLEGVIGKRKASHYVSRRSADWIKLKCDLRQEFVIGGYTDPAGSRSGIGSLLLGVHDAAGTLRYAGNVGTGFSVRTLDSIKKKLAALHSKENPFSESTGIDKKAHWVQPVLLAEVSFGQWTNAGRIRHAVFHGLRTDKPAAAIIRETSMPIAAADKTTTGPAGGAQHRPSRPYSKTDTPLGKLKITHPDRVIDESTGIAKIDLIRYYALVAPLMLEHLKNRPVSLVRAPDGIAGQLFFQKHLETNRMAGVRQLPTELDPGHEPLMEVASEQGLLSAAQMNVIEFHTWNAIKTLIGKPDRMTFDLDPGKGVQWPAIQEAALVMRAFLNELDLVSFVKTSGGKGLHVIVPLRRRHDWDTVKDFSHAIVLHLAQTFPKRLPPKAARATGWGRFSSTICAMVSAPPRLPPGRPGPAPAWACPCRFHGKKSKA